MHVATRVTLFRVLAYIPKMLTYIGNVSVCVKGRIKSDSFWEEDAAESTQTFEGGRDGATDKMT
jgi:hypothetical protein